MEKCADYSAKRYNQKVVQKGCIEVGDLVLIKLKHHKEEGKHKLSDKYEPDTYVVVKKAPGDTPVYHVRKSDGKCSKVRVLHRNLLLALPQEVSGKRSEELVPKSIVGAEGDAGANKGPPRGAKRVLEGSRESAKIALPLPSDQGVEDLIPKESCGNTAQSDEYSSDDNDLGTAQAGNIEPALVVVGQPDARPQEDMQSDDEYETSDEVADGDSEEDTDDDEDDDDHDDDHGGRDDDQPAEDGNQQAEDENHHDDDADLDDDSDEEGPRRSRRTNRGVPPDKLQVGIKLVRFHNVVKFIGPDSLHRLSEAEIVKLIS